MTFTPAIDPSAMTPSVSIAPVLSLADRLAFIRFARRLYAADPHYRSLPDLLVYEQLSPSRNPWFEHGRAQLFIARRGEEVVGRISAQIDFEHLRIHDDQCGFFGFFECEDDPQTARALLQVAEDWCRAQGMTRIRGPFSFSINEECGNLVEGFDTPNYVMMTHGRPYYERLIKEAGYEGAMDLFAWRYIREHPPEQVQQIADAVAEYPGLVVRKLDMDNLERDVAIIMDIFNDAWSNNWGFVPLTPSEVAKVVRDFRLIADPEICLIAEVDGEPAAMAVALPNVYESLADLDGKLFPLGWAKALYRLKYKTPRSFRQILLGVRRKFRGNVLGGLSLHLYVTIHRNAYARGYQEAEASWTLANNDRINHGMAFMGAEHYKTYRIYEKTLV
jgi:hypothetical protein